MDTSKGLAEIAHGLVTMCRQRNFLGAVDRFHATDVHTVEPSGTPHVPAELTGIDLVKARITGGCRTMKSIAL